MLNLGQSRVLAGTVPDPGRAAPVVEPGSLPAPPPENHWRPWSPAGQAGPPPIRWNIDNGETATGETTWTDEGVTFVTPDLPAGDHAVTLLVLDPEAEKGEDSVLLHVVPNEAPTVTFLAPTEGQVALVEDPLRVEVRVVDDDEVDLARVELAWGDLAAGAGGPTHPDSSGAAVFLLSGFPVGTGRLSVTATDAPGATASALVSFEGVVADGDGDGYRSEAWGGDDCDDDDASVHPGADEGCDGADHDCDGRINESDAVDAPTWHEDEDGDGYGDADSHLQSCTAPAGWIEDGGDCNDDDPAVNPAAVETCDGEDDDCDGLVDEPDALDAPTWYADGDGDGFGDPTVPTVACTAPSGTVANATDCDDADATAFPGAAETCDGADDDCDGVPDDDPVDAPTWYVDADGDGAAGSGTVRACTAPTGTADHASDCDDADATVFPGAPEVCNGRDDDCDGTVDEPDAADAPT